MQWLTERMPSAGHGAWLHLGRGELAWGGWPGAAASGHVTEADGHPAARGWAALLRALPEGRMPASLGVSLDDALCRWWLLPADTLEAAEGHLAEVQAQAEHQAAAAWGLEAGSWAVALQQLPWASAFAPPSGLATCAVPHQLLQDLRAWATERGTRLRHVQPLAAATLAAWLRNQPSAGEGARAFAGKGCTLLALARGRSLVALGQLWHESSPDGLTAQHGRRLALAAGHAAADAGDDTFTPAPLPTPGAVSAEDRAGHAHPGSGTRWRDLTKATPDIDLLRTPEPGAPPEPPPWRGLPRTLCATGLLLAAAAVALDTWTRPEEPGAHADLALVDVAHPHSTPSPPGMPEAISTPQAAQWRALLGGLEHTLAPDIEIDELEIRRDGNLRLVARGTGPGAGLAWSQRLARVPGLQDLRLLRQEPEAMAPEPGQTDAAQGAAQRWLVAVEGPWQWRTAP